jgi:uncharacterized protein
MLFAHWRVPPSSLTALIPSRLSLDTFEGMAYVTLAAFTVAGARVRPLPRLPGLSTFHELNARTYVSLEGGNPGIWFFSLDAASPLAVAIARAAIRLPYYFARVRRDQNGAQYNYECMRHTMRGTRPAFVASWIPAPQARQAEPGSLDHFLVERFALYSRAFGRKLWRGPVRHEPWRLQPVHSLELTQTIDVGDGLPKLAGEPLAHYSVGVDVEFHPFQLV